MTKIFQEVTIKNRKRKLVTKHFETQFSRTLKVNKSTSQRYPKTKKTTELLSHFLLNLWTTYFK